MSGQESTGSHASRTASTVMAVGAVFVAWSLISVPVPGVNEPHYLTKARNFADPAWCRDDFFLQSANAHAVFYNVVGPVTKVVSLATAAVLGRVLSLLLLASGWVLLGRRIGLTCFNSLLAACIYCLIAASGNFSGEWVVGGFESKVPAYGFGLLAVAYWLDGFRYLQRLSYVIAGITAGLSVSLHPVVGLWFCVAMAMSEVCLCRSSRHTATDDEGQEMSRQAVRTFLTNSLCFIAASVFFALPGLIPALQMVINSNVDKANQDTANFIQIFWRLAHHLDPSTFPAYAWLHAGVLCAASAAALLFGWWLNRRNRNASQTNWLPLVSLLISAAVIAVVGVAIGWHSGDAKDIPDWKWRASLLRFYPFRLFDGILPMVASFAFSAIVSRIASRQSVKLVIIIVAIGTVSWVAFNKRPSAPSAYNRLSFSEWKVACKWLNDNTAVDSLVWGPRESFGLKWFANRAEYVCFKDCPQDAAGILEWNQRLWKVYHWSQAAYQDGRFDDSDLKALYKLTGIDYVLTRQLGPFESEPVYQNNVWRIYEVPK